VYVVGHLLKVTLVTFLVATFWWGRAQHPLLQSRVPCLHLLSGAFRCRNVARISQPILLRFDAASVPAKNPQRMAARGLNHGWLVVFSGRQFFSIPLTETQFALVLPPPALCGLPQKDLNSRGVLSSVSRAKPANIRFQSLGPKKFPHRGSATHVR